MPHTKILEDHEVTIAALKAAINLHVVTDESHVSIRDAYGQEVTRSTLADAAADAADIWTFLQGNAFSGTETAESVYACRVLEKAVSIDSRTMDQVTFRATYERIIRSLPDFDEKKLRAWYLAIEFSDDVRFIYAEYDPHDPTSKWLVSIIFNEFLDHAW